MEQSEATAIQVYARVRPPTMKAVASGNEIDGNVLGPTGKGNFATPAKPKANNKAKVPESALKSTAPAGKLNFSSMKIGATDGQLGLPTTLQFDLAEGVGWDETSSVQRDTGFEMDAVFGPAIDQKTIFDIVGQQHVHSVVDGFNSTVFAYGRTSSGKTHTIVGPASQRYGNNWTFTELEAEASDPEGAPSALGLVPRCLHALLARIHDLAAGRHFTLRFACAEIYNQKLFDLCASAENGAERAEVRDGKMTTSAADRISWHDINVKSGTEEEAMLRAQHLICRANAARVHASTAANMDSSRSHVLYLARVASVGPEGDCREAMLSIVDLAGSESLDPGRDRGAPGSASASRDHETRSINSSLHTLTRVVQAYATAPAGSKPAHVPYRESLLTLLLKDSIGGNCLTSIIVTVSADDEQLVHSYKSCQFARLARGVRNVVKENKHYDPGNVIASLRAKVAELQEAIVSRDAAAAAESGLGPRLGSLLSLSPPPEYPLDGIMDVVGQWVDTAAADEDSNAEEADALFSERVQALAALSKALAEYVKSSGVSSELDEPVKYDMGTGTSPWMARGAMLTTGTGAGMQGGSPTLLKRQDMSSAVDPSSIRAGVLGKMLDDTHAWLAKARGSMLPMLKCAAGVLENRMARLSSTRSASPAEDTRLTISAASDDAAMGAQRDYARLTARIEALEGEIQAAEARLEAIRDMAAGEAKPSTPSVAAAPSAAAAAVPAGPGARLPPSSSLDWQVWSQSDQEWQALPDEVSAVLQEAVDTAGHGVPSPVLAPCGKGASLRIVRAVSELPTVPALPKAGTTTAVMAGTDSEALASAAYPAAAVRPFASNTVYRLNSDGCSGQQVCVLTGQTRAVRRLVYIVAQGDIMKKSKWTGQWVPRTMRLTPSGLVQLYDAYNRREARRKVAAELGPGASASAVRAALARMSVDKVKARFADMEVKAEHSVTPDNEGREFTVRASPRPGAKCTGLVQGFRTSSVHEARMWVDAINAAAAGAFTPSSSQPEAPNAPVVASSSAASLGSIVTAVTAARVKEAATRATRLAFDSDALAALTTPLVPPARSFALICKELALPWATGLGEAPCGTPCLLPVSGDTAEWAGVTEYLGADLQDKDAWAALASVYSLKASSVHGARLRRVLRVQNAVLAQRYLGLCAEHRYRNGRKALSSGWAFGCADAGSQVDALLSTCSASDAMMAHVAGRLGEAVAGQAKRMQRMLEDAGVAPGASTALEQPDKAQLPVIIYRVAYSNVPVAAPARPGHASQSPVRKTLSAVLDAGAGAAAAVEPPAVPTAIASVAAALEKPAAVVALYPAYVVLLSMEQLVQ